MTIQDVTVARCAIEDIDAVVRLLGILFDQEADFSANPVGQRRAIERVLAQPELGTVLVAREAERAIGTVMLLRSVSTSLARKWVGSRISSSSRQGAATASAPPCSTPRSPKRAFVAGHGSRC